MTRISPSIIDVYTTSSIVEDQSPVAVTAAETIVTFSSRRKSGVIYNDGPNAVHVAFNTTVTTNNFIIPSKWAMQFVFPVTTLHFICNAAQTATLYILGER